ncbi:hypothetical protein A8O28_04445 [Enterobacteriaceae bacterium CCUG 67584]|nr:hypothetical protein [Enterobacteriaceae bacterium CCUG 67584]
MTTFSPTETLRRPQRLWQVAGLTTPDGLAVLKQIETGLDGKVAGLIAEWVKISKSEVGKMSGIPPTTFGRSVKDRFSPDQSERLVRVIRVIDRAVELFEGDKVEAQKWLFESNRALGWKAPAALLSSETGAYEVLNLITRLEHGVYS